MRESETKVTRRKREGKWVTSRAAAAEDKRKEEKPYKKPEKNNKKRLFLIYCINVRGLTSREQRRHQSETKVKRNHPNFELDRQKQTTQTTVFRQRERTKEVLGNAPGRPAS